MRVTRRGSVDHPITINDQFLDRLGAILNDARNGQEEALALKSGVGIEMLRKIRSTPIEEFDDPPWPEFDPDADMEAGYAEHRRISQERREKRELSRALDKIGDSGFDVSYDNGFRTSCSDLDQLRELLGNEPGRVESISAHMGPMYEGLGVRASFGRFRPASYDVAGERKDVDAAVAAIENLLKSSQPDHPILHRRWFHFLASILVCALAIAAIFDLTGVTVSSGNSPAVEAVLRYLISLPLGVLPAAFLAELADRVFPLLQVEFGDDFRKQRAARARFGIAFFVVLIPIIINILF